MNEQQPWHSRVDQIAGFFEQMPWLDEPKNLYQAIADHLVGCTGCDSVNLRMLSVAGDEMIGCASSGSAQTLAVDGFTSVSMTVGRMPRLERSAEPIVYDFANPAEEDVESAEGLAGGYSHAVTVPLRFEGALVGAVDFIYKEGQFAGDDEVEWLAELCRIVGSVMGMVGVSDRMTELRISDEARRIGVELHDNLAQPVSVISLEADKALMSLEEGDFDSLRHELDRLREAGQQACSMIRQEVLTLQDSAGETEDLEESFGRYLERFKAQWGIPCTFEHPEEPVVVTAKVGNQAIRILHEALSNVVRHAKAKAVIVALERADGTLSIRIEDDGCGFDARSVPEGKMGLRLMRERAARLGGKLVIASVPGEGTSLVADIPIAA
ncbi:MAG: GAF domain-containing sensor histidine kinase [Eggerthellaceae bacterium]|nr:GAF domain-containing sensor histidine kinase [Eggerthellaceae bacterium]